MAVKLIIAGSRTVDPSVEDVEAAVRRLPIWGEIPGSRDGPRLTDEQISAGISLVISGDARGGDAAGDRWARSRSIEVHHEPITEEDVRRYGKYVAPKHRNMRMAERGDLALVFWNGISNGTTDLVTRMVLRGKPVEVVPTKNVKRASRPR